MAELKIPTKKSVPCGEPLSRASLACAEPNPPSTDLICPPPIGLKDSVEGAPRTLHQTSFFTWRPSSSRYHDLFRPRPTLVARRSVRRWRSLIRVLTALLQQRCARPSPRVATRALWPPGHVTHVDPPASSQRPTENEVHSKCDVFTESISRMNSSDSIESCIKAETKSSPIQCSDHEINNIPRFFWKCINGIGKTMREIKKRNESSSMAHQLIDVCEKLCHINIVRHGIQYCLKYMDTSKSKKKHRVSKSGRIKKRLRTKKRRYSRSKSREERTARALIKLIKEMEVKYSPNDEKQKASRSSAESIGAVHTSRESNATEESDKGRSKTPRKNRSRHTLKRWRNTERMSYCIPIIKLENVPKNEMFPEKCNDLTGVASEEVITKCKALKIKLNKELESSTSQMTDFVERWLKAFECLRSIKRRRLILDGRRKAKACDRAKARIAATRKKNMHTRAQNMRHRHARKRRESHSGEQRRRSNAEKSHLKNRIQNGQREARTRDKDGGSVRRSNTKHEFVAKEPKLCMNVIGDCLSRFPRTQIIKLVRSFLVDSKANAEERSRPRVVEMRKNCTGNSTKSKSHSGGIETARKERGDSRNAKDVRFKVRDATEELLINVRALLAARALAPKPRDSFENAQRVARVRQATMQEQTQQVLMSQRQRKEQAMKKKAARKRRREERQRRKKEREKRKKERERRRQEREWKKQEKEWRRQERERKKQEKERRRQERERKREEREGNKEAMMREKQICILTSLRETVSTFQRDQPIHKSKKSTVLCKNKENTKEKIKREPRNYKGSEKESSDSNDTLSEFLSEPTRNERSNKRKVNEIPINDSAVKDDTSTGILTVENSNSEEIKHNVEKITPMTYIKETSVEKNKESHRKDRSTHHQKERRKDKSRLGKGTETNKRLPTGNERSNKRMVTEIPINNSALIDETSQSTGILTDENSNAEEIKHNVEKITPITVSKERSVDKNKDGKDTNTHYSKERRREEGATETKKGSWNAAASVSVSECKTLLRHQRRRLKRERQRLLRLLTAACKKSRSRRLHSTAEALGRSSAESVCKDSDVSAVGTGFDSDCSGAQSSRGCCDAAKAWPGHGQSLSASECGRIVFNCTLALDKNIPQGLQPKPTTPRNKANAEKADPEWLRGKESSSDDQHSSNTEEHSVRTKNIRVSIRHLSAAKTLITSSHVERAADVTAGTPNTAPYLDDDSSRSQNEEVAPETPQSPRPVITIAVSKNLPPSPEVRPLTESEAPSTGSKPSPTLTAHSCRSIMSCLRRIIRSQETLAARQPSPRTANARRRSRSQPKRPRTPKSMLKTRPSRVFEHLRKPKKYVDDEKLLLKYVIRNKEPPEKTRTEKKKCRRREK